MLIWTTNDDGKRALKRTYLNASLSNPNRNQCFIKSQMCDDATANKNGPEPIDKTNIVCMCQCVRHNQNRGIDFSVFVVFFLSLLIKSHWIANITNVKWLTHVLTNIARACFEMFLCCDIQRRNFSLFFFVREILLSNRRLR